MSVTSDEINYLIYRYLLENGFSHSAYSFSYESMVARSSISHSDVPPGALIALLQKGLEYVAIEEHINEDGSVREYDGTFSLLSPLICEALAQKEDRHMRRNQAQSTSLAQSGPAGAFHDRSDDGSAENNQVVPTATIPPSVISLKRDTAHNRWLLLTGHSGEVFMCMWNPTQRQLASGSADGMCRLWKLSDMDAEKWNGQETTLSLKTAILQHSVSPGEKYKDVTSVTWSPDGRYLATGCYDGMARIWDNNGNLKSYLKEHTGPVFSLKWNKQGNYILSGSYDKHAIVWNAETGEVVKKFQLHSAPVLDVDWKDSDTFATCSSDKTIFVCKVSSSDNVAYRTFTGHNDEVNAVCWSPGGMFLASCSDDSTAKIWSVENGLVHDLKGHFKEIYTVRWTPTGPGSNNPDKALCLCTASFDGTVRVWDAFSGEIIHTLEHQRQPVYSIAPSPNGEFIATGSLGGDVAVWSLQCGKMIREMKGNGDTFDVSWSHDGSMLCSCFSSGSLHILDVAETYASASQYRPAITDQNNNNNNNNNNHQQQHNHRQQQLHVTRHSEVDHHSSPSSSSSTSSSSSEDSNHKNNNYHMQQLQHNQNHNNNIHNNHIVSEVGEYDNDEERMESKDSSDHMDVDMEDNHTTTNDNNNNINNNNNNIDNMQMDSENHRVEESSDDSNDDNEHSNNNNHGITISSNNSNISNNNNAMNDVNYGSNEMMEEHMKHDDSMYANDSEAVAHTSHSQYQQQHHHHHHHHQSEGLPSYQSGESADNNNQQTQQIDHSHSME